MWSKNNSKVLYRGLAASDKKGWTIIAPVEGLLQTEISGKYKSPIYFFLYFLYHSSCRNDQFSQF